MTATGGNGRTVSELGRVLDEVRGTLQTLADEQKRGHAEVLGRFDGLRDVYQSREVADLRYEQVSARLAALESRSEWVVRTIGGTILANIVAALYLLPKVH